MTKYYIVFGLIILALTSPKLELPPLKIALANIATISSSTTQNPKLKFDSKSMIGKGIDFDENGNFDCFDLANEKIYKTTGVLPPKWKVTKNATNIVKNAKSILTQHKQLMTGQPAYQFITNPKNYELEDIVITDKGKDGHVAVVIGVDDNNITVVEQDTYVNKPSWTKSYAKSHWQGLIRINK